MSLLSDTGHSNTGHPAPALPCDPATRCRCLLEFRPGSGGDAVVVCVSGEVDAFTRPILAQALTTIGPRAELIRYRTVADALTGL